MPDADSNRAEIPSAPYGDLEPLARLQLPEMSIRNLGVNPADVVTGEVTFLFNAQEIVRAALDGEERVFLRRRIVFLAYVGYELPEIRKQTGLKSEAVRDLIDEILPLERRRLRALERLRENSLQASVNPRIPPSGDDTAQMKF